MSNTNFIFCKNHSNRKAYRFCDSCKEFICNSCAFNEKHIPHLQQIKSLKDLLKIFFPNMKHQNISNLSKYIELFQFILNYNSSFMPFDLNEIMVKINDKFDTYINKLIELKIKFKILISEKFGIIQNIFAEQEKKVIETQNKLIYILNNGDINNLEKMNIAMEQIVLNKNEKQMLEFIEEFNQIMRQSFDDDSDFEDKYKLFTAQKLLEKSNQYIKENILDNIINDYFDKEIINIDNLYQKIFLQNNEDINTLKANFDYINKENNLDDEDKKVSKPVNNINNDNNINLNKSKNNENNNIENIQKENGENVLNAQDIKPEDEKNQIEYIQNNENEKNEIEYNPNNENEKNEIEYIQNNENENNNGNEFNNDINNDINNVVVNNDDVNNDDVNNEINNNIVEENQNEYEAEKEIIDIEFDPPEIETGQFTKEELAEMDIDDDYENEFLKIEEEGDDGSHLAEIIDGNCSDDASFDSEQFYVDNLDDKLDIQYYEGIKFEGDSKGEGLDDEAIVDDANDEENKEEIKKEDEIKKDDIKKEISKKPNIVEEDKKQVLNINNKQINPSPQNIQTKPQIKPADKKSPNKKKEKDKNINIAEFIEDKPEQEEIKQQEEKTKLNQENSDIKLLELCTMAKLGKKTTNEFQEGFKNLSWESRAMLEIFAVDQKNSSLKIYNELIGKIDEIKTDFKLPIHLSYINIPPYLYISGGKLNGKDLTSVKRIIRTGQNSIKCEEISQLNQGRNSHCMIYIKDINSLYFISGSRIKLCEKYSFTKKKMESFPALNVSREKCSACVINKKYLYVFFGFDRTKNKFETSIERILVHDPMSWEMINLSGNQNILKKQSFSCIPLTRDEQNGVIITGGINSLRNETKETVYINMDKFKAEVFAPLPHNSSFNNSNFINFDKYAINNEIINFSNEFNVERFNLDKYEFS